ARSSCRPHRYHRNVATRRDGPTTDSTGAVTPSDAYCGLKGDGPGGRKWSFELLVAAESHPHATLRRPVPSRLPLGRRSSQQTSPTAPCLSPVVVSHLVRFSLLIESFQEAHFPRCWIGDIITAKCMSEGIIESILNRTP